MKKIYDKNIIQHYIENSKYHKVLSALNIDFFLIQYEKGELVTSPHDKEILFQIIEQGAIDIYFVRDDGTRYALSNGTTDYFIGDMEIFHPQNNNIYAEAVEQLTCICFSIEKCRSILLSSPEFLQLICVSLSEKMSTVTAITAAPASLSERLLSYIKYKCSDGIVKGVERTAFLLHCSPRQLQRVLNQCERDGLLQKIGKGSYQLTKPYFNY